MLTREEGLAEERRVLVAGEADEVVVVLQVEVVAEGRDAQRRHGARVADRADDLDAAARRHHGLRRLGRLDEVDLHAVARLDAAVARQAADDRDRRAGLEGREARAVRPRVDAVALLRGCWV